MLCAAHYAYREKLKLLLDLFGWFLIQNVQHVIVVADPSLDEKNCQLGQQEVVDTGRIHS